MAENDAGTPDRPTTRTTTRSADSGPQTAPSTSDEAVGGTPAPSYHESRLTTDAGARPKVDPRDSGAQVNTPGDTEGARATLEAVQEAYDREQERGYRGLATDPTPNENYTASGVNADLPTPETERRIDTRLGQQAIVTNAGDALAASSDDDR